MFVDGAGVAVPVISGVAQYHHMLSEAVAADIPVFTVHSTDRDSGLNREVTYTVVNATAGAFVINKSTGVIRTGKSTVLDRETHDSYIVYIRATDGGTPALSTVAKLNITMIDANDNHPKPDPATYFFAIYENTDGQVFIGRLNVTDDDQGVNAKLRFSITSVAPGSTSAFYIDPADGDLYAVEKLDRELSENYTLAILVGDRDGTGFNATISVIVRALDTNDNPPVITTPSGYSVSVTEHDPLNTTVVVVHATDIDAGLNQMLEYAITDGNERGHFGITSTTGRIYTTRELDRENVSFYSIEVTVTDLALTPSRQLNATAIVNVTVLDINDHFPRCKYQRYAQDVYEDTNVNSSIWRVIASDSDAGLNRQVTFSIAGGNTNGRFQIDSTNGLVTLESALDRERVLERIFNLTINVTDGGGKTTTCNLDFVVADKNDEVPTFLGEPFAADVTENALIGTPVIMINATDNDIGINQVLRFSLELGPDSMGRFEIDNITGLITVAGPIDRETHQLFHFNVTVTDSGGAPGPHSVTTGVTISVLDMNDNAPKFDVSTPHVIVVSEHAKNGSSVIFFKVSDDDLGSHFHFELQSIHPSLDFEIGTLSGDLRIVRPLDRERVGSYEVIVKVFDGRNGNQVLFATHALTTSKAIQ